MKGAKPKILQALARGPLTTEALAERVGESSSHVSRSLQQLKADGKVVSLESGEDSRRPLWTLTNLDDCL